MNTKTVIKNLHLDDEGFKKISESVKKAESKTSGEIVVCLTAESSDYSVWEFSAALVFSFVCFAVMIPFTSNINAVLNKIFWINKQWYLPVLFGAVIFVAFAFAFYLFNIPALDRLVIPSEYKKKMVSRKALSAFAETGVYCTENHNGILIFVSYLERQVRIVADKGISQKISSDMWQLIADSLVDELKNGNGVSGFCDAIEKCGELLTEYYPIKKDDVNELSDGLYILED